MKKRIWIVCGVVVLVLASFLAGALVGVWAGWRAYHGEVADRTKITTQEKLTTSLIALLWLKSNAGSYGADVMSRELERAADDLAQFNTDGRYDGWLRLVKRVQEMPYGGPFATNEPPRVERNKPDQRGLSPYQ